MTKQETINKLNELGISFEILKGGKLISAPAYPDALNGESDPRWQQLNDMGAEMSLRGAKFFFQPDMGIIPAGLLDALNH